MSRKNKTIERDKVFTYWMKYNASWLRKDTSEGRSGVSGEGRRG